MLACIDNGNSILMMERPDTLSHFFLSLHGHDLCRDGNGIFENGLVIG